MISENNLSDMDVVYIGEEHIQYFQTISDIDIKSCCQVWQQKYPNLAVEAFLAEADAEKLPMIQQEFKDMGIPLMGAIFPELVYESEFKVNGILLICFPQKPLWHLQADMPQDESALNKCLVEVIQALNIGLDIEEETALFIIFDAMLPNIATILDELYGELGDSVHYMGVNAGSETFQPMPCLFDNERIVKNQGTYFTTTTLRIRMRRPVFRRKK